MAVEVGLGRPPSGLRGVAVLLVVRTGAQVAPDAQPWCGQ
jgi:hypothetical protein